MVGVIGCAVKDSIQQYASWRKSCASVGPAADEVAGLNDEVVMSYTGEHPHDFSEKREQVTVLSACSSICLSVQDNILPLPLTSACDGQSEKAQGKQAKAVRGHCDVGHRNSQTVKGVSFLGEGDRFVMSGSDDGHIYIWSTSDGILRQWLPGDRHVVNCLEPHPCQPLAFATSGKINLSGGPSMPKLYLSSRLHSTS